MTANWSKVDSASNSRTRNKRYIDSSFEENLSVSEKHPTETTTNDSDGIDTVPANLSKVDLTSNSRTRNKRYIDSSFDKNPSASKKHRTETTTNDPENKMPVNWPKAKGILSGFDFTFIKK